MATGPSPADLSGIFKASILKARKGDFGFWYSLGVLSLLAVGCTGLALAAVFHWMDFGQIGPIVGWACSIVAAITLFLLHRILFVYLKIPPGMIGKGIRILSNKQIELVGIVPGKSGAIDPLRSIVLRSGSKYIGSDLVVLVNILRTQHRGWMVGNLALTHVDGRSLVMLDFINVLHDTQSQLYVSEGGEMRPLSADPIIAQLRHVSKVLSPSGATLQLTFTEFASGTSDAVQMLGAIGGVAIVAASNAKQSSANSKLRAGDLPVEANLLQELSAIVKDFHYRLIVNENAKQYRKW